MPTGLGSWASEGEALQAIGTKIADELSRDLFLQHVNVIGQKVTVSVQGVPDSVSDELLRRELVGLPAVISALPSSGTARTYDLQLGGTGASGAHLLTFVDLVFDVRAIARLPYEFLKLLLALAFPQRSASLLATPFQRDVLLPPLDHFDQMPTERRAHGRG